MTKQTQLLARVNFPLYTVKCLTERHILVAGGGGSAKTGIPNVIQIYELIHDRETCRAVSLTHYETGDKAIMNCAVKNAGKYKVLFAGMEGDCHMFKIKQKMTKEQEFNNVKKSETDDYSTIRKRGESTKNNSEATKQNSTKNEKEDSNANVLTSIKIEFDIHQLESFQTDFSSDPLQKLVRFSNCANYLSTAGADGHVRVWKFPEMKKLHDIEAHSDDVDDLDICPYGEKIISVSRDGKAKIWNIETGTMIAELKYAHPVPTNIKYIFRSCRFGIVEDKNELAVFATLNPASRSRPASNSFICKWNTKEFSLLKTVSDGKDMLTTMAISDNGHFIGLGTQEGSVKIYIAFSLQVLYKVDHAHGIFVTGLEFLPTCDESRRITGGQEASLVSISVDNHIVIHHIPTKASIGYLTLIILLIMFLFIVFIIMDFFNL